MITIGVDFHKRTSSYCVLDAAGNQVKQCKMENNRDDIRSFMKSIPNPKQVILEATRNWGLYHDCIYDIVDRFRLGNPRQMKAITESETKNDRKDAHIIARLAHSGFLPEAHVSSLETRQLRSLLRFRHSLVVQRVTIRNQVHILIDRNLWPSERPRSFKNPLCRRGLKWLAQLQLPERERFILEQCIESYQRLNEQIKEIQKFIQQQTINLPGLEFIRTVPGFCASKTNIFVVLLETDNVNRFHSVRGFVHYAGLVPREHSSGDKHRAGHLVKQANIILRNAFIESTHAAILVDRGLRAYYMSVKQRSGSGSAVIATARKLATAVYYVLKEQRSYRPEPLPPAAASSALLSPCSSR